MQTCFILNDTRAEKHHGCEVVMQHLRKGLQDRQIKIIGQLFVGQMLTTQNLKTMLNADLVIINGEGTLHDSAKFGQYLIECGCMAKQAGKKVWLINSTWENNNTDMLKKISSFDGVYLRDLTSLKTVKDEGIQAYYAPDLTFAYPHDLKDLELFTTKNQNIIVTDSVFSTLSGQMYAFSKNNKLNYSPMIKPLPLNFYAPGFDHKKLLKSIFYKILSIVTLNIFTPRQYYNDLKFTTQKTSEFIIKVATSNSIITARYHALCFAIQLKVPFLCLDSNTKKIHNILTDIGIDPNNKIITINELYNKNHEELEKHTKLTEDDLIKIESFNHNAKLRIQEMFDKICS